MATTTANKITTRGYIFDIYHIKDKAILWLKGENDAINILFISLK